MENKSLLEMNDFTENEQTYIDNFLSMKESVLPRDISIFQSPILSRKDLLQTILWIKKDKSFSLASFLNYTNKKQIIFGKTQYLYNNSSYAFWNLNNEKEFSDTLTTFINDYLPKIQLTFDFPSSPTTSNNEQFLRHYEKSIHLLLAGPPHADQYEIDEALAANWIAAQKTPERRRLAKVLIEKTLYISHSDLLKKIQETIEKIREKLIPGLPVVFLTGPANKSNYYISLLFYHFWTKAGLSVDTFKVYLDEIIPGNILDIDEMAYSGTQTTGTLSNVYKMLVKKMIVNLDANNCRDIVVKKFCESRNFLPLALFEKIMDMKQVNYILVRIFCSEQGEKELLRVPHGNYYNPLKFPSHLIIGQKIPSPDTLFGKKNSAKLSILFGAPLGRPASAVYFNHKIANLPSTFLFPYAYGVVPDAPLLNEDGYSTSDPEEKKLLKEIIPNLQTNTNSEDVEFMPFIRYCQPGFRFIPRHRKNLVNYEPPGGTIKFVAEPEGLPQKYRCPFAWYKRIDYETGTYTPLPLPNIPLPYGPTEGNFVGGYNITRRIKKQKKTRKNHK
jgi:hypothetical protein